MWGCGWAPLLPALRWQMVHCGPFLEGVQLNFLFFQEIRVTATNVTWGSPVRRFVFNDVLRNCFILEYRTTKSLVEENRWGEWTIWLAEAWICTVNNPQCSRTTLVSSWWWEFSRAVVLNQAWSDPPEDAWQVWRHFCHHDWEGATAFHKGCS